MTAPIPKSYLPSIPSSSLAVFRESTAFGFLEMTVVVEAIQMILHQQFTLMYQLQ
jgi:hypothetical protein